MGAVDHKHGTLDKNYKPIIKDKAYTKTVQVLYINERTTQEAKQEGQPRKKHNMKQWSVLQPKH